MELFFGGGDQIIGTWSAVLGNNALLVTTLSFSKWKYAHYFTLVEHKDKNILVKCKLCLSGSKVLSTAINSNSNLSKHLRKLTLHASTKLEANPVSVDTLEVSQAPPAKQQRLDFNRTVSQGQINKAIAWYVVENMQPVSTVESPDS